jgi:hypothetical protein
VPSDDDDAVPDPDDGPRAPEQARAIMAKFREQGIDDRDRRAMMADWTGVSSVNKVTRRQASEILARLNERAADAEAATADPAENEAEQPEADETSPPASRQDVNRIARLLRAAQITSTPEMLQVVSEWAGRPIARSTDLTAAEAARVIENATALAGIAQDNA